MVEKASCDEAFIDVTDVVNQKYASLSDSERETLYIRPDAWGGCFFIGHKEGGGFLPENELDQKLFLANDLALQMRKALFDHLHYRASCGIGHNKTLAKLASGKNKPNAQTCVPLRYIREGLREVKINDVRFCGGKVCEVLQQNGVSTMGEVQEMILQELRQMGLSESTAELIKNLSWGSVMRR